MKSHKLAGSLVVLSAVILHAAGCESTVVDVIGENQSNSTSGVPGANSIANMTEAERETFCAWYGGLFWEPAPSESREVLADGTVVGYAGFGCAYSPCTMGEPGFECGGGPCATNPSLEHCKASLAAQPCSATVAQLEACLRALLPELSGGGGSAPFCPDAATPCAPFLNDPSCVGTIVAPYNEVDGYCHVRVE